MLMVSVHVGKNLMEFHVMVHFDLLESRADMETNGETLFLFFS